MVKTIKYADKTYKPGSFSYSSKAEKIRCKTIVKWAGKGKVILDLGCYDGTLGKKLIDAGNIVYGIEASKDAAICAEKKGIRVKVQDIESDFDYGTSFFDCVIAGEIIEHIVDTDAFLERISKVLKTNGSLVLSTPNVASLGRRILLLLGKNPYFEASLGFPKNIRAGHLRYYTKDLLLSFLKHKDFEVIKYASDVVNISCDGKYASKFVADLFPTFGRSLIVKARKMKK